MASPNKFSTNLGLGANPDPPDPRFLLEFGRVYNAAFALAANLDALTGAMQQDSALWPTLTPENTLLLQNMCRLYVRYNAAATIGQAINLFNNAGVLNARLADATVGVDRLCMGYCSVVAGVAAGAYGEVILAGIHPYVAGATPGSLYYLSTVAGSFTLTKPSADSASIQAVGYALSATDLWFMPMIYAPKVKRIWMDTGGAVGPTSALHGIDPGVGSTIINVIQP